MPTEGQEVFKCGVPAVIKELKTDSSAFIGAAGFAKYEYRSQLPTADVHIR